MRICKIMAVRKIITSCSLNDHVTVQDVRRYGVTSLQFPSPTQAPPLWESREGLPVLFFPVFTLTRAATF